MEANSRLTINVADETFDDAPGEWPLARVNVSMIVESLNGVPIIVERSMWWPSFATNASGWIEAHDSPGATESGVEWAVADGELNAGQETFILIANTSAFEGTARVTLMFDNGGTLEHPLTLPASSRTTVNVRDTFPSAEGRRFGARSSSLWRLEAQCLRQRRARRILFPGAGAGFVARRNPSARGL